MNTIRLMVAVLFAVVELSAQQRPESLPFGTPEKVRDFMNGEFDEINWGLYKYVGGPYVWDGVAAGMWKYRKARDGDPEAIVQRELPGFLEEYTSTHQASVATDTFQVRVSADVFYDRKDSTTFGSSSDTYSESFKFTKGADGKWHAPASILGIKLDYSDYNPGFLGIRIPGVKWVEMVTRYATGFMTSYTYRNGAQPTCWVADLYGNGIVYFSSHTAAGNRLRELKEQGPSASQQYILYWNEEKTDFTAYEVETGLPTKVFLKSPRLEVKGITGRGVRATIAGVCGEYYTIESSTDISWSKTIVLGTVQLPSEVTPGGVVSSSDFVVLRDEFHGFIRARTTIPSDFEVPTLRLLK